MQEYMHIEHESVQILRPQRHVAQYGDGERGLRLGKGAEVRFLIALDLRPQSRQQISNAAGSRWVVELAQRALFLSVKPLAGIGTLLAKRFNSVNCSASTFAHSRD
jgi:hypothetical protein